jgi:hypothetical protein
MTKIINIQDHIESEKQKKLAKDQKRQIEGVQKTILCSSCPQKCSRCGAEVTIPPFCAEFPLNLCPICVKEYEEYTRFADGLETKNISWHNQEWKEMWQAWLEYQKALKKFQQSREITDLFKND